MSFSFTAVGDKDDVVAQLRSIKDGTGRLAVDLAQLLAGHINEDHELFAAKDYRVTYVVTAQGHSGGGSPSSLTCAITPHYVRVPPAEDVVLADELVLAEAAPGDFRERFADGKREQIERDAEPIEAVEGFTGAG